MTALLIGALIVGGFIGLMFVKDGFWEALGRVYERSLMLFGGIVIGTIGAGIVALGIAIDGLFGAPVLAVGVGVMARGGFCAWIGLANK